MYLFIANIVIFQRTTHNLLHQQGFCLLCFVSALRTTAVANIAARACSYHFLDNKHVLPANVAAITRAVSVHREIFGD